VGVEEADELAAGIGEELVAAPARVSGEVFEKRRAPLVFHAGASLIAGARG
jgi:hypothetical protein